MTTDIELEKNEKALISVEKLNPLEVFTEKGVEPILYEITKKVKEFVPDVATAKGRKEIASLANRVARSKTLLDDLGKNLVAEWKQKAAVVDNSRKKIRDELDALKAEARAPLTKWENDELARVSALKNKVATIQSFANLDMTSSADSIQNKIDELNKINIDESWQEFQVIAQTAKENSLGLLRVQLSNKIESDRQRFELERLRRQEQEQMALAHERHLRELEEKARAEKARLDLERIEAEKNAAVEAQKAAEERARIAEENAKREAELSAKRELERIEREKAMLAEQERRIEQANKAKAVKIKESSESLCRVCVLDSDLGLSIVQAISDGKIKGLRLE